MAALLVSIVAPTDALAGPGSRYASPTGTSAQDCTSPATACDIATAIDGSGGNVPTTNQNVVLAPGTYTLNGTLTPTVNTDIHGTPGQPRPVISASGFPALYPASAFSLKLSDLEFDIHNVGGADSINTSGATFDRVIIKGDSGPGNLCQCYGGTIRDSVIIDTATVGSAWGINSNGGTATETLRNDTFVATGAGASAMWIAQGSSSPSGPTTADATNVIAINTAGGTDVRAFGKQVTITMAYSDYANPLAQQTATITDGGHNVSAAPVFKGLSSGDLRERATSGTVDAALDDAALNGTLDVAGNPRQAGTHTDIGAFEYQPPAAIAASGATNQSAVVGTPFAQPLQAKVTDAQGQAVSDIVVTFTAPGGGASGSFNGASSAQATTGADGVATAPVYTGGHVAGTYSVTASLNEIAATAQVSLRNLAGAPATLTLLPHPATIAAGQPLPLSAKASDVFGNDLGRVAAALSIAPNGSCTVTACNALIPGPHTITATIGALRASATVQVTSVAPGLRLARRPLALITRRTRTGTLTGSCSAPAGETCVVSGRLTVRSGRRTVAIGSVSGRLGAGRHGTLTVRLTPASIARRSVTALARLRITDLSGTATTAISLTLRSR